MPHRRDPVVAGFPLPGPALQIQPAPERRRHQAIAPGYRRRTTQHALDQRLGQIVERFDKRVSAAKRNSWLPL